MLTISKPLSSSQARRYHEQEFSNSQDNYYSEGDRVRGEWHGKLAAAWGLKGEVGQEHFARLAEGQHPLTGVQLVEHRAPLRYLNEKGEKVRRMEHRAGWDGTFSAPKTISLTALVGRDERVRAAHRESVNVALDELEKYVQARMGGNHPPETTGKWVAAKFEHDSSRPVDGYAAPQLHTHVVFFNLTERENGETRALQPQPLYRSQQYATAVYRSELASRLKELGYETKRSATGAPEIRGYTEEYVDASSPRRHQIKEHLEEEGLRGAAAAQIAAHRTRDEKLDVSHEEMQQRHQAMAEQYGNQPQQVVREAQARAHEQAEDNEEKRAKQVIGQALDYARERNLEREAVADGRDLLRDALKRSMGEASFKQVQTEFNNRVGRRELIEIGPEPGAPGRAFTTEEMIGLERENIRLMREGQDRHPVLVEFEARRAIANEYTHLSNSQRAAVEEILRSRDRVTALEGVAGAGKTTSLAAVRDAAEREGYQVEGFAPTSGAAQKLEEAGIKSNTLQHHLARGEHVHDEARHLYVLDESSLAGSKQINEFFGRLGDQDRVLLVGDVRQHEAVEAGRPYHQLQEAGMRTAHLDEIVRQKGPALKEAVEQLARGEVYAAINSLERHGRVHEIAEREERLKRVAQGYGRHPEGTLVVSPDNDSRRELNLLIHREMQQRGQVKDQEHAIAVLEPRQELTGADRAWAALYQQGDVVRYSRGSKVVGIEAGAYATVTHVETKGNQITVVHESGKQLSYDPRRLQGVVVYRETEREFSEGDRVQFTAPSKDLQVANRELGTIENIRASGEIAIRTNSGKIVEFNVEEYPHLDYGYAVTSHGSQGQTADRVLIHVDTEQGERLVNSRMAYVAVSRGRYDAEIYTNDKAELGPSLARDVSRRTATEHDNEQGHDFGQKIGLQAVGHERGNAASIGARAEGPGQEHDHASGQQVGPASVGHQDDQVQSVQAPQGHAIE